MKDSTTQLTKELKDKWITALKSGDYVQGTGELKTEETDDEPVKHCCLGVLCEVHPDFTIDIHKHTGLLDSVLINGVSSKYRPFNVLMGEIDFTHSVGIVGDITEKNDKTCDGKYTNVIPLIEALPTVD